jgi:hypothetical protein
VLDVKRNKLDVPDFISTTNIPLDTNLSARAMKTAASEALGIVKSRTEKRRKQLFVLAKKMREGCVADVKKLQSKIDSNPLTEPTKKGGQTYARLNSACCEFIECQTGEFDGFLKLHCLGKSYGHIYLPIKWTRHSNKFVKNGFNRATTWMVGTEKVMSVWQKDVVKSTGTKVIGADQGYTTCLSLSDNQVTGKCPHGHDLASIIDRMSRKKRGSKAFKRSQAHRTNYVNWAINQLNLTGVGELRLEKLHQMRRGVNMGSHLGHWTYTAINEQIISRCEQLGVRVVEQSATYRSQRCHVCGWTQKSNRKGKEFVCRSCGAIHDADINGALNHEADLYRLPAGFWQMNMNKTGFYWTAMGLFDSFGQELIVPDVQKPKT